MTTAPATILVVTVVHHPEDARIRYREIIALLDDGWQVTYAAPFTGYNMAVPSAGDDGNGFLRLIDLPRARGRRRLRAMGAARRLVQRSAGRYDLVLLHDPELLLSVLGTRARNVVWDVHEDTAAAVIAKPWIPRLLKRVVAAAVHRVERWAERRMPLLLAEYAYQERFERDHPVVPNAVRAPRIVAPPTDPRVVYLGAITTERGADETIEVARLLQELGERRLVVDIIGDAHGEAEARVREAHRRGVVRWHGFVPSETALQMLNGALAGLCLLHDLPNYRHSMPTKILEYMAHGVPVITTPLPLPAALVAESQAGMVVPFEDPQTAADAVLSLVKDPERARAMGAAGHTAARDNYDWALGGEQFARTMRTLAEDLRN